MDFSLEQLADIVVTSVSRQETRLAEAPASIYVISGADIRRAGAVAAGGAAAGAEPAGGARRRPQLRHHRARLQFHLENKLLVLIDGRSVYSPLFSGVFWDMQDVLMEDIERIEVISGPGATIWGANAVNGVINIITRAAADTQGGLLVAGGGSQARSGALRYGGALGNGGHYRVYGQYTDAADTASEAGVDARNGWRRRQAGFRADWSGGAHDVTVSGDAYQGTLGAVQRRRIRGSPAPTCSAASTAGWPTAPSCACKPTSTIPNATARPTAPRSSTRSTSKRSTACASAPPQAGLGRRLPLQLGPDRKRPGAAVHAGRAQPALGQRVRAGRDRAARGAAPDRSA